MTIKELLLRIINNEKLPERVIYHGCWYDLDETRNYSWYEDLDCIAYYLFEYDIFEHLEEEVEVIWELDRELHF